MEAMRNKPRPLKIRIIVSRELALRGVSRRNDDAVGAVRSIVEVSGMARVVVIGVCIAGCAVEVEWGVSVSVGEIDWVWVASEVISPSSSNSGIGSSLWPP